MVHAYCKSTYQFRKTYTANLTTLHFTDLHIVTFKKKIINKKKKIKESEFSGKLTLIAFYIVFQDSLLNQISRNLFQWLKEHLLLVQKPSAKWRLVQPRVADYWSSWGTCWVCSYKNDVSLGDFYNRTTARGMILSHIKAIRACTALLIRVNH